LPASADAARVFPARQDPAGNVIAAKPPLRIAVRMDRLRVAPFPNELKLAASLPGHMHFRSPGGGLGRVRAHAFSKAANSRLPAASHDGAPGGEARACTVRRRR